VTDKPKDKPATIFAAIPRAMSAMKRLAKDSRNAEQKYDFASVDDFLAMTGPILADNGLFIHMDENGVENFERQGKYGVTHWARYDFILTVYHESGESLPLARRSVEVIRSGAQAAGSAQSYVLKQFQRALFNIPTGDKDDPDFAEKADGTPVKQAPKPRDTGPTDAQIAHDRAVINAQARIESAESLDDLKAVFTALAKPVQADTRVIAAKDDAKVRLTLKTSDDLNDEIPY
jgi:hypothetical protein